jgi:hypothetical protein
MRRLTCALLVLAVVGIGARDALAAPVRNGPLPSPLVRADNWWRADVSTAPVDPGSAAFISFIGATRALHPDFGGEAATCEIYGFPYATVGASQAKRAVQFDYASESDGVDPATGQGVPFYPIPDEAITQCNWIEGGPPGNQNPGGDRHMLLFDTDNQYLYELFSLFWDGTRWTAGSGAFFDLKTNNRRPEGWTSADAAGLAILPGLVRYDEVFSPVEIAHAFRVTVRATNGHVYPASHSAGSTPGALPMGARLRLKASKDISGFTPEVQRIFRAMKKYGLIVADNGSDMFVSGVFDTRWNNDVLNPAFAALKASDFEVVQRGWQPPAAGSAPPFGSFDTPASGTTGIAGAIAVTGWALDDVEVTKVQIYRNPIAGEPTQPNGKVYVGDATFVPGARPDVASAYPGYPFATRAGWGYMLLTNFFPPAGGNGTYTLHAYAVDGLSQSTLLGSKTISLDNAHATKPFGTLDTPGQGQTVSGAGYVVFGWALTPPPGVIPTDGSTLWLAIDGQYIGHPTYNQYRSDIAGAFPGYANSNGAVGYSVIDTTTLANGMHTIGWLVTDDLGRAEGLGSRFFWVQN